MGALPSTAGRGLYLLAHLILFLPQTARSTEFLAEDQVALDAALNSAADGDTVTILGDGIHSGTALVSSGVHLRCVPRHGSDLLHLEIVGVPAPVIVEGVRFTGSWEDPDRWDPVQETTTAIHVQGSQVRFDDCHFEELQVIAKATQKYPVNGVAVLYLEDSDVDFQFCRFHRVRGSYWLAEGPSWGVIGQWGEGSTRFSACEFSELGIPIRSRAPVEIDACRFTDCYPGLIEAGSDLYLSNSLIVRSGPLHYVYDELSIEWTTSNVITVMGQLLVEGNTFVENPTLYTYWGYTEVLEEPEDRLPLIDAGPAAWGSVRRNLFIRQTAPVLRASTSVQASCNDAWQTNGEAWVGGIGDVTGIDGNISEAPLFCDRANGDYTLSIHSPAATADCGPMGAFPTACTLESPVAVRDFAAWWEGEAVALRWELAGLEQVELFVERLDARGLHEIYRGSDTGFVDAGAPREGVLRYALGFVHDGERISAQAWAVPSGKRPLLRTRLLGAVPNPFNPRTEIRFELASPGDASLEIYDVVGRRIHAWRFTDLPSGEHRVIWRGTDDDGVPVASGVYHLRLEAGGRFSTQRLALLR